MVTSIEQYKDICIKELFIKQNDFNGHLSVFLVSTVCVEQVGILYKILVKKVKLA